MTRYRLPLLIFVALLVAWEIIVRVFDVPDYLFPSPLKILQLVPTRMRDLGASFLVTAMEALGGFLLSAAVGVVISLLFSVSLWVRRCFYPYVVVLQTIPIIAISPLILLWLGNGTLSVTFISFLISFPAVVVNTTQGLISIDANLLNLFRMGGARLPHVMFKLRLPHALPSLFAGLKIAAGASVVGALVGETFAGSSSIGRGGLGYSSIYALSQLDTVYLFLLIVTSSILGLIFFFAVSGLERFLLGHWHESIVGERME
jgi:NitT/TauT family transport system permease protein